MATARQLQVYQIHKIACQVNGHGQTAIRHRQAEGTLTAVAGFPNNTDYKFPGPRSTDSPLDPAVNVWMTWQPRRIMGISDAAADTKAAQAGTFRMVGQCPAIDDNGNQISFRDNDFGTDPQGHRFRIENPVLSPDNSFWSFEIVKQF